MPIPKTIHQIWLGGLDTRPSRIATGMARIEEAFGDYTYRLWTESDFASLDIEPYACIRPYAALSDLMRYRILLLHGGWYLDADCEPIGESPRMPIGGRIFIINAPNPRRCWNGLIGSEPDHTLMRDAYLQSATVFDAYVDESADWVLALDADSLTFSTITPILHRAEQEDLDFLGRRSGRPRRAPRSFNRQDYRQLFHQADLRKLPLHVPNVFLIRGHLSPQLAEHATRWTNHLYHTKTHVLGRPLWSDQVAFTLALAELRLPPNHLAFFHVREVSDWNRARRLSPRPTITHFGTRRWPHPRTHPMTKRSNRRPGPNLIQKTISLAIALSTGHPVSPERIRRRI